MKKIIEINLDDLYGKCWVYLLQNAYKITNCQFPHTYPPNLIVSTNITTNKKYITNAEMQVSNFCIYDSTGKKPEYLFPIKSNLYLYIENLKLFILKEFNNKLTISGIRSVLIHLFFHELFHYYEDCEYFSNMIKDNSGDSVKRYHDHIMRKGKPSYNKSKYNKGELISEEMTEKRAIQMSYSLIEDEYSNLQIIDDPELRQEIYLMQYDIYSFQMVFNKKINGIPSVNTNIQEIICNIVNSVEESMDFEYQFIIGDTIF